MTAKLGSGTRFKSLSHKLGAKGASNPKVLAAWIGRRKYGSHKMAQLSAKGRHDYGFFGHYELSSYKARPIHTSANIFK